MMRRTVVAPLVLAVALAISAPPAYAAPTTAGPATASGDAAGAIDARKGANKLTVKRSSQGYHQGMKPVKVRVSGAGQGKATFFLGKKKRAVKKLKKGRASWTMPKHLAPGTYKVRVKVGKRVGQTKVKVHNSQLKTSATSFTISKSASSATYPEMPGTVRWKGKAATQGYVDIYRDGKNKEGNSSPNYCCMAPVSGGTFTFGSFSFLGRIADKYPVGTYRFQAFYTPTASFSEYIHSAVITVVITP